MKSLSCQQAQLAQMMSLMHEDIDQYDPYAVPSEIPC